MNSYSQINLKNFNRIAILNYIHRHRHATKAGLAEVTGLTFMAIKKILEELISLNLVRTDAYSKVQGHKAVTYTINENYGYTVGLHINIYETRAAVMNLGGQTLARKTYREQGVPRDQVAFINRLVQLVEETVSEAGIDRSKLLGLGVGAPGPVNTAEGIVLTPPNYPPLRYLPVAKIMENRLGLPTLVQKDTNILALAEYWYGAGADKNASNLVYIDADMGIGSGLILGGELYKSSHFSAGEFGHITLDLNGPRCNCGNCGCLEALGSGIAIQKRIAAQLVNFPDHPLYAMRDRLTIGDILSQAAQDDVLCMTVLNQSAFYMATAINTLTNLLDPSIIVLGGVLAQGYKPYFDIVQSTISRGHIRDGMDEYLIRAKLGEDAGIVGAGELVSDNFFTRLVSRVFARDEQEQGG